MSVPFVSVIIPMRNEEAWIDRCLGSVLAQDWPRDRMEVLEIPGYTEQEKLAIARDHLVQKKIANHGLTPEQLTIADDAIRLVVRGYTREAGVRSLERGNDALMLGKQAERVERLVVGGRGVLHASGVLPVAVLGSDAGVIEAGAATVHIGGLAGSVLQHIAE